MPEIALTAEVGRPLGSPAARRLRRQGKIPGVVYGHGMDPLAVAVDARALRAALSGESGTNALLALSADDATYLTLARELQRHPVRGTIAHVDFQIVRRDEVIATDVPVTLVGEATEVHRGDGLVDQQLFTLTVHALPADIPTAVEVDVGDLVIGGSVRVADLRLPPGVSTDVDGEAAVVVGQPPRVQVAVVGEAEMEAAEAAGEGAPAEEGRGAGEPASDDGGQGAGDEG